MTSSSNLDPVVGQAVAQALRAAHARHIAARKGSDLAAAFSSAAETAWWICALDDQLGGADKTTPYSKARNLDPNGRYIRGVRWVRNRHTHQLPITTSKDEKPFFPGPPFYLSAGFIWRPFDDFPPVPARQNAGAGVYKCLMAGQSTIEALTRSAMWLQGPTGLDLGQR